MFNRILVLCMGNICRSPVAEALLQTRLPNKTVESAGLGALVDQPAEPTAAALARKEGLDLTDHRGRQISSDMLRAADLILVMSESQRAHVRALDSTVSGKTMLLGHWLPGRPDIPDPYKKSNEAFEHVHQLLVDATNAWIPHLK